MLFLLLLAQMLLSRSDPLEGGSKVSQHFISCYVNYGNNFPLTWLVSSAPLWQLTGIFWEDSMLFWKSFQGHSIVPSRTTGQIDPAGFCQHVLDCPQYSQQLESPWRLHARQAASIFHLCNCSAQMDIWTELSDGKIKLSNLQTVREKICSKRSLTIHIRLKEILVIVKYLNQERCGQRLPKTLNVSLVPNYRGMFRKGSRSLNFLLNPPLERICHLHFSHLVLYLLEKSDHPMFLSSHLFTFFIGIKSKHIFIHRLFFDPICNHAYFQEKLITLIAASVRLHSSPLSL